MHKLFPLFDLIGYGSKVSRRQQRDKDRLDFVLPCHKTTDGHTKRRRIYQHLSSFNSRELVIKTKHQSKEQAVEESVDCSSAWGCCSDHCLGPTTFGERRTPSRRCSRREPQHHSVIINSEVETNLAATSRVIEEGNRRLRSSFVCL